MICIFGLNLRYLYKKYKQNIQIYYLTQKKNYDNIIAAANDPTIDVSLDIATGVIDNIFYAGEIRYSQLNNKRKIDSHLMLNKQ